MVSNVETGNATLTFKEAATQPRRLDFVEATSKYINTKEYEKNGPWSLGRS